MPGKIKVCHVGPHEYRESKNPSDRKLRHIQSTILKRVCYSVLSRFITDELHSEEFSVAFNKSIGVELDGESSVMSTATEH